MDDDEVLLTKFIMCGGYFWHAGAECWFAIEPGCIEKDPCHHGIGRTPQEAVREFIETYGAPWEKSYVSFAMTLIVDGLTTSPTETSK